MKKFVSKLRMPISDIVKRWGRLLFSAFVIGLIFWGSRKFIENMNMVNTIHILQKFTPARLAGFVAVSLIAVWLTFLYDFVAIRRIGLTIATLRIMKVSWISNTFNNVAGFGGIGGAGARMLLYRSPSVDNKAIRHVSLLIIPAAITGLGCLMLLNLTGLTGISRLIHEYKWLPILIAGFAAYIPVYCWFTNIRLEGLRLIVSRNRDKRETHTRIMLTAVSALDWAAASLVLWLILRSVHPGITIFETFGLFSIATAAGITSMIPGGLGSFDLMLVTGLHAYGASTEEGLAALLIFRFFYYALPLLLGAILAISEASPSILRSGKGLLRKLSFADEKALPPPSSPSALLGDLASKALYFLILSGGILLVLSASLPGLPDRIRAFADLFSMPLLQMSHRLSLVIGLSILLLSEEILMRVRRAWTTCLILIAVGGIFTFMKGMDFEEMIYMALVFLLLLLSKPVFFRVSKPVGPYRIVRPVIMTALAGLFYILSGQPHTLAAQQSQASINMLHFTGGDFLYNGVIAFSASWLWYALWILTMDKPGLAASPPSMDDFTRLEKLLAAYPGNSHTHLLFLGDKRFFWASDGHAMIPYQKAGDCLVALGGPIGAPESQTLAFDEFRNFTDRYGLTAVFYQVTEDFLPSLHDQGFDFFKLGEEAFVELADFDLRHPHFKSLRNVRSRIEREGYQFDMVAAGNSECCIDELRRVSDIWLAGRSEKHFSLGFFNAEYLSRAPIALIRSSDGDVIAFASLMPSYRGIDEISIDLMRFVPESPNGIMDYLFLTLMQWAVTAGYKRFNFGMAPLSNVGNAGFPKTSERLAGFVYNHGNRFYSFDGLFKYKKKFRPKWHSRYMAYPRKASLTTVLVRVAALINR